MSQLRIAGGTVHDPAHGVSGEVRDVCIDGGGIVGSVPGSARRRGATGMVVVAGGVGGHSAVGGCIVDSVPASARRLDATGMVVMPGGVDIHSHVAGSSVNIARRLLPDEHDADPVAAPALDADWLARSGTGGTVPSTFT